MRSPPDIRDQVSKGNDTRPRLIADAIGLSYSGIYGMISRGEIEVRRIGEAVIIPNREARRLLGLTETHAEHVAA